MHSISEENIDLGWESTDSDLEQTNRPREKTYRRFQKIKAKWPKGERPPTVQRSVKRCHLLKAIEAVKNRNMAPERFCHYVTPHGSIKNESKVPKILSQNMHLLLILRNAMARHDWSTAAVAVKFMIESNFPVNLIHASVFQILFNHPQFTDESLRQFLSEALNLRTEEEQQNFLARLLHLPQDFTIYNSVETFQNDVEGAG